MGIHFYFIFHYLACRLSHCHFLQHLSIGEHSASDCCASHCVRLLLRHRNNAAFGHTMLNAHNFLFYRVSNAFYFAACQLNERKSTNLSFLLRFVWGTVTNMAFGCWVLGACTEMISATNCNWTSASTARLETFIRRPYSIRCQWRIFSRWQIKARQSVKVHRMASDETVPVRCAREMELSQCARVAAPKHVCVCFGDNICACDVVRTMARHNDVSLSQIILLFSTSHCPRIVQTMAGASLGK